MNIDNKPSLPIIVEIPHSDKPTEWGVSFDGPIPTDEMWIPCRSEEIALRLHLLVHALVTNMNPNRAAEPKQAAM
jgi:hypothetical protein